MKNRATLGGIVYPSNSKIHRLAVMLADILRVEGMMSYERPLEEARAVRNTLPECS